MSQRRIKRLDRRAERTVDQFRRAADKIETTAVGLAYEKNRHDEKATVHRQAAKQASEASEKHFARAQRFRDLVE